MEKTLGGTLGTSFNKQFDQHGAWRIEFAMRLKLLAEWFKNQNQLGAAVQERLHRSEHWLNMSALAYSGAAMNDLPF